MKRTYELSPTLRRLAKRYEFLLDLPFDSPMSGTDWADAVNDVKRSIAELVLKEYHEDKRKGKR